MRNDELWIKDVRQLMYLTSQSINLLHHRLVEAWGDLDFANFRSKDQRHL